MKEMVCCEISSTQAQLGAADRAIEQHKPVQPPEIRFLRTNVNLCVETPATHRDEPSLGAARPHLGCLRTALVLNTLVAFVSADSSRTD